jgi:hypothetical protein
LSAGDDTKTREELLAEIDALKAKLERQSSEAGKPPSEKLAAPVFSVPVTRRGALASWVAPVILSLPVLGTVLKPGTAHAVFPQDDYIAPTATPTAAPVVAVPTAKPTFKPSIAPTTVKKASPTAKPAASPTAKPAASPTAAPAPTAAPSAAPTSVGRCIPSPTVAPTLGMGAAPDSRPIPAGVVALGAARAVSGLFDTYT